MIPTLQFLPPAVIIDRVALLLGELELRLAHPQPAAADIHKIRVCSKKLRSWIRLLRHRQHTDRAIKKILCKLAPARDSVVLRQTIEQLQTGTRSARNRAACRQVLASLPTPEPVTSATGRAALSKRVVRELLDVGGPAGKTLQKGVQLACARSVRLARRAFTGECSTASLHRLRRWVKYLGYQLELVTLPTPASEKFRKQLVSLGRILGRIHDFAVLQQLLGTNVNPHPAAAALVAVQATRLQRRLLQQAEKQARTVLAF